MKWVWTWGGKCFGYIDGVDLWTYDGKHAGRFHNDAIYGSDGKYLGELLEDSRLITSRAKKAWVGPRFTPLGRRETYARFTNYVPNVMQAGYEDFPLADNF